MDTMTYLALKTSGLPKNRIIGMGGALDSARFKYQLASKLNASPSDLNAIVIGGHGDTTMIPLISKATWNSIPVSTFLSNEEQADIIKKTMVGGATLTALIGTSAWYAPGAATAAMVKSIVLNENKLFTASVYLEGEMDEEDLNIGVPVIINKKGWDKIVPLTLNDEEQKAFKASAEAVRNMNAVLKDSNII